MKKFCLSLAVGLLTCVSAFAIPANRQPRTVQLSDGTSVTVYLHGDEYHHWSTTADNYTVVRDDAGNYTYAIKESDGSLVSSGIAARNPEFRSQSDNAFLAKVGKNVMPVQTDEAKMMRRKMASENQNGPKYASSNSFRGLVILFEYTDLKFTRSDYAQLMKEMVGGDNFTGYTAKAGTSVPAGTWVECTGSVRDYFRDNSNGRFTPAFDVVGPVQVNYASTYVNGYRMAQILFRAVLSAADSQVDFSKYDSDGDGTVDLVYFIAPGFGSNFEGNDSRLLWPHQNKLLLASYDGKMVGDYACSVEKYGTSEYNCIDGIGSICHEFSHCLGIKDEYDTDYSTNGQSYDPAEWSLMAGGSYNNYGRTPAGYTLQQRAQCGFAFPRVIKNAGDWEIGPLQTSNDGLRLNSPVNKEYFLFENRQLTKWDAGLPGHGLLVWRVDSTSVTAWSGNKINANASHNYLEVVRAGGPVVDSEGFCYAEPSDPFPGTKGRTILSSFSSPALKTWAGKTLDLMITRIREENGVIKFSAVPDKMFEETEDFESFSLTNGDAQSGLQGKFATWSVAGGARVVSKTVSNGLRGSRGIELPKGGNLTSTQISGTPIEISFLVKNTGTIGASLKLSGIAPGTNTPVVIAPNTGGDAYSVAKQSSTTAVYSPCFSTPISLYLTNSSRASNTTCYIDNLKIVYEGERSGIDDVKTDGFDNVNTMTCVAHTDGICIVKGAKGLVKVYTLAGALVNTVKPDLDGDVAFELPMRGIYIIADEVSAVKTVY